MTLVGWLQVVLLFLLVLACTAPLGAYMYRVFTGGRTWLTPVIGPIESAIYRVCRINPDTEMSWQSYAFAIVGFSVVGFAYLYALLRTQAWLPLNPQGFGNLAPDLAWNTAVSFLTNTNWQFYSGESTMSYLSQMAGLAWHNFVSAAMGIAVAVAVIRGLHPQRRRSPARQFLGRPHAHNVLCVIAALGRRRTVLHFAGDAAEFRAVRQRPHAGRRHAGRDQRADGLAGDHQESGDQRRRFRQCELSLA